MRHSDASASDGTQAVPMALSPGATLETTKRRTTALGVGCAAIGQLPEREAVALLAAALRGGILLFETGRSYGNAEAYLGEALAEHGGDVVIASKSLAVDCAAMSTDFQRSLDALRRDHIGLYQLHGVDSLDDLKRRLHGGAYSALEEQKNKGTIGGIGISTHSAQVAEYVIGTGLFTTVMLPCNLGLLSQVRAILAAARQAGIGTIAMKPLAGGMLAPPPNWKAKSTHESTPDMRTALAALLSLDCIDAVVPGPASEEELAVLLELASSAPFLTERDIAEADAAAAEFLGQLYCRRCKYCCPCSKHGWAFDFPEILRLLALHEKYQASELARARYAALPLQADACDKCGDCEERCPFRLPVRDLLQRAARSLG